MKNTKLSNTIEAREASRAEGRSPFLLWLIWVVWLPLSDDGAGASFINNSDNEGNGLRGLTERVETLGGRCKAFPREGGGFLLAVSVPLALQNHDAIRHDTITATLSQQTSVDPPVSTDSIIERSEQG